MIRLTKDQQISLKRIYDRGPLEQTYLEFRRSVFRPIAIKNCVMVYWQGMHIGIEEDGHAHS